ncbi:MAG: caspase family protein [Planctomycetes bacterium]|nr:caspase family protein [Planctomycetota bacterium]
MKIYFKISLISTLMLLCSCFTDTLPATPFQYSSHEFVSSNVNFRLSITHYKDADVPDLVGENIMLELKCRDADVVDIDSANTTARFAVGYETGIIDLYNWSDFNNFKTIDTKSALQSFEINQTGSHVAVINKAQEFSIYSVSDGSEILTQAGVAVFAFSPIDNLFAIASQNSVRIYKFNEIGTTFLSEIKLAEKITSIKSIAFPPMKDLIGILFSQVGNNGDSDVFKIYSLDNKKPTIIAYYSNTFDSDIVDFRFLVPKSDYQRIIFMHGNGNLRIHPLLDFQNAKTLKLDSESYKFKLCSDLRKYAYVIEKGGESKFEVKSFFKRNRKYPEILNGNSKMSFEFSPSAEAILVDSDDCLKLINLDIDEFKIGKDSINWTNGEPSEDESKLAIAETKLIENANSPLERESNVHKFEFTVENQGNQLSRVFGDMIFSDTGKVLDSMKVYFGRIDEGRKFLRTVKFKYPTGFLKGVPKVDLKIYTYKTLLAEKSIDIAPTDRPVPKLALNWYFAEDSGGKNGIVEPDEAGKINLILNNSGRADAIITSFMIDYEEQDVLKISAGTSRIIEIELPEIDFSKKYVSYHIDIDYSNAFFVDSKIVKLSKTIYVPVLEIPIVQSVISSMKAYVFTDFAYLRSAPSQYSHPLATLKAGSVITINTQAGLFYKINGYINSAGEEIPVWIEKTHLVTSSDILDKLGISIVNVFAPDNVFDAPPLVVLQKRRLKELDTFVPDFDLSFRIYTPEGQKNIKIDQFTNGKVLENKKFVQIEMVDDFIIDEVKEYNVLLMQDKSYLKYSVVDSLEKKSELNLVLNLRKTSGELRILCIGIGEYDDLTIPQLNTAENDAKEFAKTMKAQQLTITLKTLKNLIGTEATKSEIEDGLNSLVRTSRKDDIVVVYFSGHSIRDANAGISYILPYDCIPTNLEETAITVDFLRKTFGKISSEQKLLIVDNTSEFDIFNSETSAVFTGIANNKTTTMLASDKTQRGGMYKRNGTTLFTSYIIEGLTGKADEMSGNNDGFVTVS